MTKNTYHNKCTYKNWTRMCRFPVCTYDHNSHMVFTKRKSYVTSCTNQTVTRELLKLNNAKRQFHYHTQWQLKCITLQYCLTSPFFDTNTHIHCFKAIFFREPVLASFPMISLLYMFLTCASYWDRPKLFISSLAPSYQVFFLDISSD